MVFFLTASMVLAGFLSVLVPPLAGKWLSRSFILSEQMQAAVEERRTGCLVCG
jgi:hypothetical protein